MSTRIKPSQGSTRIHPAAEGVGGGILSDGNYIDIQVGGSGTTMTIKNDVVTFAKMTNIPTNTVVGRLSSGAGDPESLSVTQLTTMIDSFTSLLKGSVPASGGGTANFLRADGTWASPGGMSDGDKGDITVSSGGATWTIDASTITNAKLANMATLTIKGNNTGGSLAPIDLTVSQVRSMLSVNLVENTALSTWIGSSNITTLGTIITGVWHGTALTANYVPDHNNLNGLSGGAPGDYQHLTTAQVAALGGASLELEMEMAFKQANLANHKVLTWTLGQLTSIDIWTSPAMLTKLFSKVLTYTGSQLDQTVLTRISDSATLTRVLAYDIDGNLISVTSS